MSRFHGIHAGFRILAVLVLLVWPAVAASGERVALLIGNSRYDNPELSLRNPENDVAALGSSLRGLGFEVIEAANKDRAGMMAAIADFGLAAEGAEIALFFYAGHGVQVAGENYFIGTNFAEFAESELANAAVTMSQIREQIEAAKPDLGIMIIDACRNNPFVEAGQVEPGLVRSKGGAGLLIAYATDPGNVAYDGTGQNSVFTEALLAQIATPGLEARIMFGRVRQDVVLKTGGAQIPWVEESVLGEYYFASRASDTSLDDSDTNDLRLWREIFASPEPGPFEDYLREFPDGLFSQFARDRVAMLRQSRIAGTPSGMSNAELLAEAEPVRVASALTVLGFLSRGRSLDASALARLEPAFGAYRAQLPNPGAASVDQLYTDAARMTMFLAATTAQGLRTDIVALASVGRTLKIAGDALTQIAEIASTDASAKPVLDAAQSDIEAIRRSQEEILQRLDQSRTYYDDLLAGAVDFFPADVSLALLGEREQSRGLLETKQKILRDAGLFLRHVSTADEETRGSYAWLIDFLPKS